jgi:signal transduction histidine kinase
MSSLEVPAPAPASGDELAELCAELQQLRLENQAAKRRIGELRDAVAARDQFIAIAGHELRNPMGAIVLGVSNLVFVARRDDSLPAWATARLESLERQARNFVRRATTLLDVSRLASGELRLDRDLVSLSDVAREVVRDMAAEAERARCELRLSIEDGVEGWWDRTAIEQISVNLLSNAVKYGAGRPVEISISSSDEYATLKVRDHGPGISEMDRARIFERFERAVSPRAMQPGFGLGLWITRQLVAAHGGQITVESKPGVGSVFTARLPRAIQDLQR